jgi:hypothetical protein
MECDPELLFKNLGGFILSVVVSMIAQADYCKQYESAGKKAKEPMLSI